MWRWSLRDALHVARFSKLAGENINNFFRSRAKITVKNEINFAGGFIKFCPLQTRLEFPPIFQLCELKILAAFSFARNWSDSRVYSFV